MKLFHVDFDSEWSGQYVIANNFTHAEQIVDRWKLRSSHYKRTAVRTIKLVDDRVLREEDVSS